MGCAESFQDLVQNGSFKLTCGLGGRHYQTRLFRVEMTEGMAASGTTYDLNDNDLVDLGESRLTRRGRIFNEMEEENRPMLKPESSVLLEEQRQRKSNRKPLDAFYFVVCTTKGDSHAETCLPPVYSHDVLHLSEWN